MKNHQSKTSLVLSNHSEKALKQHAVAETPSRKPVEVGGPKGPEPTRYGDWEKAGRCSDF